jgi:hypothetical protein
LGSAVDWGGEDTTQKPTIERILTATFAALAELGFTLAEAPFLLDRRDRHGLRAFAIENVTDRYTRDELQRLHELSLDDRRRHDFDLEIVGPVNRLARFLRPTAIRAMIGQTEGSSISGTPSTGGTWFYAISPAVPGCTSAMLICSGGS